MQKMNNTKLINILRTFSKGEMKDFEKLVASPFFNGGRNYLPFLKQIKKFYPNFDDEKLSYDYIFSKMYPGKKFNKQIIWNMNSALLDMAEDFLIQVSLKKNRFLKNYQAAGELLERKLSPYYSKKLDEMENALDESGIDNNYFMYKGMLETGRLAYHFLEDTQHLLSIHNLKKGEYIILFFLKRISDAIGDIQANRIMFNADFEVNIPYEFVRNINLESILDYARKNKYPYTWLMEMYYCTIMMTLYPGEDKYFFLQKSLFEKHLNKFSGSGREGWNTQLVNYCMSQADKPGFRREAFEINKLALKEGFAFGERYMPKILFFQIIRNSLSIGETEWVRNFIYDYVPRLKPAYQKPMKSLGLAFLYFNLKEYTKVLEHLSRVKFIDARDKLQVKSIYVRTYYELNEPEILIAHINSALKFVNSNPAISDTTRATFNRFFKILYRLVIAKEKNNYREIEEIEQLVKDPAFVLGNWLKQKIDELKKKELIKAPSKNAGRIILPESFS